MGAPNIEITTTVGPNVATVATPTAQLSPSAGAAGYYPNVIGGISNASTDTAAIQSAAVAAYNAGGGTVQLPPTTIYITSPLPMYNGVTYNGSGWQLFPASGSGISTIPDSQGMVITSGTQLVAVTTGSYDCFDWNNIDAVSGYANQKAASLAMLSGAGISNLAINGFLNGIKIGAKNTAGSLFSLFENLFVTNCTQWGVWCENFLHTNFRRIYSYYNGSASTSQVSYGHIMFANSGGNVATLNSQFKDILGVTLGASQNGNLTRGVVFMARNASVMGGARVDSLQCNRFNSSITAQAVTFTNASANIGVTDGTKFAVGMPICFSASAGFTTPPFSNGINNFNIGQIYFVLSVSGNTITVGNSNYGAAIIANNNNLTGTFIVTSGFPCVEFTATDASSSIESLIAHDVDAEAGGTTKILLQNVASGILKTNSTASDSPSTLYSQQYFTLRGSVFTELEITQNLMLIDSSAGDTNNNGWGLLGQKSTILGQQPAGVWTDNVNGNQGGVNIAQNIPLGNYSSFQNVYNAGNISTDATKPGTPLLDYTNANVSTASLALSNYFYVGCLTYSGATSTTWTLPTITSTAEGLPYKICNGGTAAAVLTLSGNSQAFNLNSTRTSITLAVGASISVVARYNSGTPYWQVTGIGGVYAAGAVTSM